MKCLEQNITRIEFSRPEIMKLQGLLSHDIVPISALTDDLAAIEVIMQDEKLILESVDNLEVVREKIKLLDNFSSEGLQLFII